MGLSPRLLNEGERVVVSTRTHVKVLLGAFLVLLLTAFLAAWAGAQVDQRVTGSALRTAAGAGIALLVLVVLVRWVLAPFARWYTTTYTVTDRRLVLRRGVVAREGRTIPLNRVNAIDVEIGLLDRLLGCGTLLVSEAGEPGRLALRDIPRVEQVQRLVADELHRSLPLGAGDDGT